MPSVDTLSAFGVKFYPFMRPIEMAPGETLTVCGAHNRQWLRIQPEFPGVQ